MVFFHLDGNEYMAGWLAGWLAGLRLKLENYSGFPRLSFGYTTDVSKRGSPWSFVCTYVTYTSDDRELVL